MKKFHSDEKVQYHCNLCIFQTIHQNSLKIHVQNVHNRRRSVLKVAKIKDANYGCKDEGKNGGEV